jgi:hypothetical protein
LELEAPIPINRLNPLGHAIIGDMRIYYWRDFKSAQFHASGRFTFHGNKIYDSDFSQMLSQLKCSPGCFLAEGPWIAGVTREELVICSINDGRIETGFPIPSGYQRISKIFLDTQRGYLVVGLGRHIVVVPLDQFELPDEPILLFKERPATTAESQKLYEFSLTTVTGDPSVEVIEGPDGMEIVDGQLRWCPETAYTGPVDVKVRVSAGSVSREQSWKIKVE